MRTPATSAGYPRNGWRQVALAPREHHQIGERLKVRIPAVRPPAGVVRVEEVS